MTESGGVRIGEAGTLGQFVSGDTYARAASGSGSDSGYAAYQGATIAQPQNYSGYIEALYGAKQDAALAQLEAAYRKNVSELDAAGKDIAPAYEAARNRTAAESVQAQRNFAEYAAAAGLNAGTAGQAQLARSVALQNNLGSLNQAQADAFSQLDLQRTALTTEYNAAIAAAKSSGSYELAAALYQEAVRVDQALVSSTLSQAQLDYNKWNANYGLWSDEQSKSQASVDRAAELGKLWLQYGVMPSPSALKALGLTQQEVQAFLDRVNP
ncbi:hypothetical protein SDC9_128808 [bioreactor metagenome]|uniref:Uncharacterized protein n=1 Tax=bioreactor metagenome TaxID=1076179 RepID=A0A645CXX9_9ZZZZ